MVSLVVAYILGLECEVVHDIVIGRGEGEEEVNGLCMVAIEDWYIEVR